MEQKFQFPRNSIYFIYTHLIAQIFLTFQIRVGPLARKWLNEIITNIIRNRENPLRRQKTGKIMYPRPKLPLRCSFLCHLHRQWPHRMDPQYPLRGPDHPLVIWLGVLHEEMLQSEVILCQLQTLIGMCAIELHCKNAFLVKIIAFYKYFVFTNFFIKVLWVTSTPSFSTSTASRWRSACRSIV